MNKYVSAAKTSGQANFVNHVKLFKYRKQVEKALKMVNKNKRNYIVVCTGHQGEPGSILDRIARNELHLNLQRDDHIIFSSKTIPTPITELSKDQLVKKLKKHQVRIFDNVHVSVLPDTEVILNDSSGMKVKQIGDIEENEKRDIRVPAFDPSDLKIKWYDAEVVKHNYHGKIFNIKTKSGRSVSITSGHSLFKLKDGQVKEEKGDDLHIGDYIAIPREFSWDKQINSICATDYLKLEGNHLQREGDILTYNRKPITYINIKLTKEFARLLGYYLAEGSAPRHISLVIGKHEEDLLREISSSIKAIFPFSNVHVVDRGNSNEITFGSNIIKWLFKDWFGENARSKRIPKFVFSADKEFKLQFLGAYINGDGCIDKGTDHFRIRMKTASKKLASDLLYLFSQVGICAKFDHVEVQKPRRIAGNSKETGETSSYVIRIQNIAYLNKLKEFLSDKFKFQIIEKLSTTKFSQQFPPESLPIDQINLEDISPKKDTFLYSIKNYHTSSTRNKKHISRELIKSQANSIEGSTKRLLEGDLLFDPIKKIEISDYHGNVFDFKVPGPQNFIGGFGGIILHNSGHGGKEDLRDLIRLTNPEHIIPSHGDLKKTKAGADLAQEMGYKLNKTVHLMENFKSLDIK